MFPEKKSAQNRKYSLANREKIQAHALLWKEIRKGVIPKQPCEKCDEPIAQAHHPNYGESLKVVWLCPSHHKKEHLSN